MMMVVFGAGASYDSVPARRPSNYARGELLSRPPLATELFLDQGVFAESLRYFPQCNPIIPYLRSIPAGVTFEHVLETLQAEGETDTVRKRQMVAIRFYLHLMIWECERQWGDVTRGITNYVTMLDQLRRCRRTTDPVLLITFNYDRLIEEALTSVGIVIADIPHYLQHDAFKLFKLHGSVHWAREVETPIANVNDRNVWDVASELIDRANDLKVSDRYRMVTGHPIGKIDQIPLFPAIAIPVETKRDFECPSSHLDFLRQHLAKVTKMLIIGWRATEQHFLKLLKDHLSTKIHVQAVAGNKHYAEEALAHILDAGIQMDGSALDGGFTEYVVSRQAERFFGA